VIRRGFWLTVGAVTGIMGYRRASAAARRVSGRLTRGVAPGLAVRTVRFARDVREGMDLYMAQHSPPEGPTLGARSLPPAGARITRRKPRPKDGH
jgi:hypothetical protein